MEHSTEQVEKRALDEELKKEIGILQRLNPEEDYSFDEPMLALVEAYKTLRLLCEGKLAEAGKLLIKTAEGIWDKEQIETLRIFLEGAKPDSPDDLRFLSDSVREIYMARIKAKEVKETKAKEQKL